MQELFSNKISNTNIYEPINVNIYGRFCIFNLTTKTNSFYLTDCNLNYIYISSAITTTEFNYHYSLLSDHIYIMILLQMRGKPSNNNIKILEKN